MKYHKRFTLLESFLIKSLSKFYDFIEILPKFQGGKIAFYQQERNRTFFSQQVTLNPNDKFTLIELKFIELIPFEHKENFINGILSFFIKEGSFGTNPKDIEERINKSWKSLGSKAWINIGAIKPSNKQKYSYIESIHFSASKYLDSFILLEISIRVSDKYKRMMDRLFRTKMKGLIIPFRYKNKHHRIKGKRYITDVDVLKAEHEDLIEELEMQVKKYLSKFIQGYFINANVMMPKVCLYEFTKNNTEDESKFWPMIDLDERSPNTFVNDEKNMFVIFPSDHFLSINTESQINILVDASKISFDKESYINLENYLNVNMGDWGNTVYLLHCMNYLYVNLIKIISYYHSQYYQLVNKGFLYTKYFRKITSIYSEFKKYDFLIRRISKEYKQIDMDFFLNRAPTFFHAFQKNRETSLFMGMAQNLKHSYKQLATESHILNEGYKELHDIKLSKLNHWIQKSILTLTFLTLILVILGTKKELSEILKLIREKLLTLLT